MSRSLLETPRKIVRFFFTNCWNNLSNLFVNEFEAKNYGCSVLQEQKNFFVFGWVLTKGMPVAGKLRQLLPWEKGRDLARFA